MVAIIKKKNGKIKPEILQEFKKLANEGNVKHGRPQGHKDGWGIALFDNKGKVIIYSRSGKDIYSTNSKFDRITNNLDSSLLMVHLRKATENPGLKRYAHPFREKSFNGEWWYFQHNGTLNKYKAAEHGNKIDSQYILHLFCKSYKNNRIEDALKIVNEKCSEFGYTSLTFMLTNGKTLVVQREVVEKKDDLEYYTLYESETEDIYIFCSEPILSDLFRYRLIKNHTMFVMDINEKTG